MQKLHGWQTAQTKSTVRGAATKLQMYDDASSQPKVGADLDTNITTTPVTRNTWTTKTMLSGQGFEKFNIDDFDQVTITESGGEQSAANGKKIILYNADDFRPEAGPTINLEHSDANILITITKRGAGVVAIDDKPMDQYKTNIVKRGTNFELTIGTTKYQITTRLSDNQGCTNHKQRSYNSGKARILHGHVCVLFTIMLIPPASATTGIDYHTNMTAVGLNITTLMMTVFCISMMMKWAASFFRPTANTDPPESTIGVLLDSSDTDTNNGLDEQKVTMALGGPGSEFRPISPVNLSILAQESPPKLDRVPETPAPYNNTTTTTPTSLKVTEIPPATNTASATQSPDRATTSTMQPIKAFAAGQQSATTPPATKAEQSESTGQPSIDEQLQAAKREQEEIELQNPFKKARTNNNINQSEKAARMRPSRFDNVTGRAQDDTEHEPPYKPQLRQANTDHRNNHDHRMAPKTTLKYKSDRHALSNLYPSTINLTSTDGQTQTYLNVEGAFHSMKTKEQRHIANLQGCSGWQAKRYNSNNIEMTAPDIDAWTGAGYPTATVPYDRITAMRICLAAKFRPGSKLGDVLLETGEAELSEDVGGFWGGKGFSAGNNHGRLLMEQRAFLWAHGGVPGNGQGFQ